MNAATLIDALATVTSEAWQLEKANSERNYWLTCASDHACLVIAHERDRIEIYGSFRESTVNLIDYVRTAAHTPDHTIRVSASRSPIAIAKDIARRLLPAYRADLARARKLYAQRLQEVAASNALASSLAEMIGGSVHTSHRTDDTRREFSASLPAHNIYVRGHTYGSDVSLELSRLTPEQAERVLAALS